MNTPLQCNFTGLVFGNRLAGALLLGFLLAAGSAASAHAQGQIASGTVSGSGSGPYTYDLTFSDASSATSPVGSVWYAWVPGSFYLPGTPTGASAPVRMDGRPSSTTPSSSWPARLQTISCRVSPCRASAIKRPLRPHNWQRPRTRGDIRRLLRRALFRLGIHLHGSRLCRSRPLSRYC